MLHSCQISFSAASYTVGESDGTATITLTRTFASGDVSVDFTAEVDTASSDDFVPIASQHITWLDSDSNEKTVQIDITPDDQFEGDETIRLVLDNFQLTSPGEFSEATLTIVDDESSSDPPSLAEFGSAITYTENGPATRISASVTISDPDSANFNGGKLTASIAANASSQDRLAIAHQGTGPGQIGVSGSDVTYSGIKIGTFSGGTGSTPLVIVLNGAATPFRTQTLARALTFRVVGNAPSTATRTISLRVADGDVGTSNTVTKSATVVAVNDAPVLDNALNPVLKTIAEDTKFPAGTPVWSLLTDAIKDPDAGAQRGIAVFGASSFHGVWQFKLNGGLWKAMGEVSSESARLLPSDAQVRFIPKQDFHGIVKLFYSAWDQTQGSAGNTLTTVGHTDGINSMSTATESATLTVTSFNDAPLLDLHVEGIDYQRGASPITLAPNATVSDVDSANFANGRLLVTTDTARTTGANVISIGGPFTVSDGDVLVNGKVIGRGGGPSGTGIDLVVVFTEHATPAIVQQLVRALKFKSTAPVGPHSVAISVSDGDGGKSNVETMTVNVT